MVYFVLESIDEIPRFPYTIPMSVPQMNCVLPLIPKFNSWNTRVSEATFETSLSNFHTIAIRSISCQGGSKTFDAFLFRDGGFCTMTSFPWPRLNLDNHESRQLPCKDRPKIHHQGFLSLCRTKHKWVLFALILLIICQAFIAFHCISLSLTFKYALNHSDIKIPELQWRPHHQL